MVVPVISDLPPAPTRNDGAADFTQKADAMIGALQPMVVQVNIALQWMNGRLTDAQAAQAAAAASASAAAQSVVDAAHQVELATAQVGLATTQAGNSATSASQAQAYAQAAGAGIAPPPVANTFLGADSLGIVGWRGIPQSFVTGDILDSARTLTAPDWLETNGNIYLQSAYPALYAEIGQAVLPFRPPLKLPDPGTLPESTGLCSAWSRDGVYLAIGLASTPFINIYKKAGSALTKLANPAVLPTGPVNGVSFSPDGLHLMAAHGTTPFVTIYKRTTDVFAKLANPADLPNGAGQDVSYSGDGQYVVVACQINTGIVIYKVSGDTYTRLAFAPAMPSGCYNANFSEDGVYLFVTGTSTPFVYFYKRTGDTFSKLADPATLPTSQLLRGSAMTRDGVYAVAMQNSGGGSLYKRTGDAYARVSTYSPSAAPSGAAWSLDGTLLALSLTAAPWFRVLIRTGDTLANGALPAITPTGGAGRGAFTLDNALLAIPHASSPLVTVYAAAPYDLNTEFQVPALTQPGTFANIKRFIKA